jgi:integrase
MSDQIKQRYKTKHPGVQFRILENGERRYIINYFDSAGRRVYKNVPGKLKDAVSERQSILDRMGKGTKVISSKLTVKDLAEEYLRTQTGHLKEKTLATYQYNLDHWVLPKIGHQRAAILTVSDMAELVIDLRRSLSSWTVRGCLTPLSRMFQYGKRRGYCSTNPVAELDTQERPSGATRQMRILSTDQIQRVLEVSAPGYTYEKGGQYVRLQGTYHVLFATAIFTGLRIGELLALTWTDVDLLDSSITVRTSKTDAGVREVVIPDFLVSLLAGASLSDSEGFVFKTNAGHQMKPRRVNRALTEALERASVPHLRFHDLRHTFASLLIGQGEDVTYVADQMGHSNPSTTLRVYSKLFDPAERRQKARERMQSSFSGIVG